MPEDLNDRLDRIESKLDSIGAPGGGMASQTVASGVGGFGGSAAGGVTAGAAGGMAAGSVAARRMQTLSMQQDIARLGQQVSQPSAGLSWPTGSRTEEVASRWREHQEWSNKSRLAQMEQEDLRGPAQQAVEDDARRGQAGWLGSASGRGTQKTFKDVIGDWGASAAGALGLSGVAGKIGTMAALTKGAMALPLAAAAGIMAYNKSQGSAAISSRGIPTERINAQFGDSGAWADPLSAAQMREERAMGFSGRPGTSPHRWATAEARRDAAMAEEDMLSGFTQAAGGGATGWIGRTAGAIKRGFGYAQRGVYKAAGWAEEMTNPAHEWAREQGIPTFMGIPDREKTRQGRRAIEAQEALTGHAVYPTSQLRATQNVQDEMPGIFGETRRDFTPAAPVEGGITLRGKSTRLTPQEQVAREWKREKLVEIERLRLEGEDKKAGKKADQLVLDLQQNQQDVPEKVKERWMQRRRDEAMKLGKQGREDELQRVLKEIRRGREIPN